jgi:hypothetical protein
MFEPNSRYASVELATVDVADASGRIRPVRYVRRRFIPPAPDAPAAVEHRVIQGERPDHLAARYFGDPTLFWRLCDVNFVIRPDELTRDAGSIVEIHVTAG